MPEYRNRIKGYFAIAGSIVAGLQVRAVEAAESGGHGSAHEAAAEHSSGGLPQFDPSTYPSQIFWLGITFLILYLFFSKKTLPAISGTIERRKEHIQSDLDAAERIRNEAEAAQDTYQRLMTEARVESSRIMTEATAAIKTQAEKSTAQFREKSAKEIEDLEQQIHTEHKKALHDMNKIAAEIASKAADQIAGITTDIQQAQTVVQSLNKKEAA